MNINVLQLRLGNSPVTFLPDILNYLLNLMIELREKQSRSIKLTDMKVNAFTRQPVLIKLRINIFKLLYSKQRQ